MWKRRSLSGWRANNLVLGRHLIALILLGNRFLPPTCFIVILILIGKLMLRKISCTSCCRRNATLVNIRIFILLKQLLDHLNALLLLLNVCWSAKWWSIWVLLLFLGLKSMVILIDCLWAILLLVLVSLRENVLLLVLSERVSLYH